MSRFKVGETVYMGRGQYQKELIVAKVIDNPLLPIFQYSFEAPNDGFACGEQSLRKRPNDSDLKISQCYKENYSKENVTRVNTIGSALRRVIDEESSGLFDSETPTLKTFDDFRVDFRPDLRLVKWLVKYADNRLIVHVGSGQGHLVTMLRQANNWLGRNAIGIEPNINKEEWLKWRISRDGANADINEILDGRVEDYEQMLKDMGKDRILLLIARPKVNDFVSSTFNLMPNGMELLYIDTDEPFFVNDFTVLTHEGISEDNELIYSIIK